MSPPAVWGPRLWAFLHAFASRVGKGTTPAVQADETREAAWIADHVDTVIPCKECRDHWKAYRKEFPGTATTDWMVKAHNSVNRKMGKAEWTPGETVVKHAPVKELWVAYVASIQESIAQGHLKGDHVATFATHIGLWRSFAS